jgi:hypothetical protein
MGSADFGFVRSEVDLVDPVDTMDGIPLTHKDREVSQSAINHLTLTLRPNRLPDPNPHP